MEEKYICPRDKSQLYLVLEAEKLDKLTRATFSYKCPVCGYRLDVERVVISRSGNEIVIKRMFVGEQPVA